jgi:hypothetical protein
MKTLIFPQIENKNETRAYFLGGARGISNWLAGTPPPADPRLGQVALIYRNNGTLVKNPVAKNSCS